MPEKINLNKNELYDERCVKCKLEKSCVVLTIIKLIDPNHRFIRDSNLAIICRKYDTGGDDA